MIKNIVFRDADGQVINIGAWEYMNMPHEDAISGEITFLAENPLPPGVTSGEEEVVSLDDGGWAAANP